MSVDQHFFMNLLSTDNPAVVALFTFFLFLAIFSFFRFIILNRLQRLAEQTKTDVDNTLIDIFRTLRPPFYIYLALYIALQFLSLPTILNKMADIVLISLFTFQAVQAFDLLIAYITKKSIKEERQSGSTIRTLSFISRLVLWTIGVLFMLSNFGVNITSLIAGLGIGGVAVALALQNILEDLFCSFAIYFDRPFIIGDFIIVGDKMGTVERIGIKTTRIRALQGEEVVISNRELTNSIIQNFKKMQERRVVFTFGITYETPPAKIRALPALIQEIIATVPQTRFDRAHFSAFADSSLNFEVVYFLSSADYNAYMDAQQSINLALLEALHKESIAMAYPTQTVYFKK